MSNPSRQEAAALLRGIANADIARLNRELQQAVDRSLIYEPGELVQIDAPRGPVVMEIIEKAEGYATYKVRLLRDGSIIEQQAGYFEPYTPEA